MSAIVKGVLARIASVGPSSVAILLATRLVIDRYGVDVFNTYVLVFSTMVMIPLNDLGAGAALTNAVAEHGGRSRATRRVALTAARVLALSGLLLAGAALTLSAAGWWDEVIGDGALASGAFGIALAAYGLSFVPGLGQSALLGANKNHITIVVQAFLAPAMCVLTAACAVLDLEPAWVIAAPGVAVLLISVVNAWVSARVTGLHLLGLVPRLLRRRRYPGAQIRSIAGPALIVMVTLPISLQSDRLVLSHFSTATEVAKYSVATQIFAPLVALIPAAARPLWPMFTQARATGIKTISLTKVIAALAMLTALGGAVLCVLSGPLAEVVGDEKVDLGIALPAALAGVAVVQAVGVPMAMALMYPAGLRLCATVTTIGMPVNILLSILVADELGATGPLVVTILVSVFIQTLPAAIYLKRHPITAGAPAPEPELVTAAAVASPAVPPPPPPPPPPAAGEWWAFQLLDPGLSIADGTLPTTRTAEPAGDG